MKKTRQKHFGRRLVSLLLVLVLLFSILAVSASVLAEDADMGVLPPAETQETVETPELESVVVHSEILPEEPASTEQVETAVEEENAPAKTPEEAVNTPTEIPDEVNNEESVETEKQEEVKTEETNTVEDSVADEENQKEEKKDDKKIEFQQAVSNVKLAGTPTVLADTYYDLYIFDVDNYKIQTGHEFDTDFKSNSVDTNYAMISGDSISSANGTNKGHITYYISLKNVGRLSAGNYVINLPNVLNIDSGGSMSLEAFDNETKVIYGNMSWSAGASQINLEFNNNVSKFQEQKIALGCILNDNAKENVKDGVVTIDIPGGSKIELTVTGWGPGEPTPPSITKSYTGDLDSIDSEITWTVKYTAYKRGDYNGPTYESQNSDNMPKYIIETLPAELKYIDGSAKVGGKPEDVVYDVSTNTIKYGLPDNGAKDVELTFNTGFSDSYKTNFESNTVVSWAEGNKNTGEKNKVAVAKEDETSVVDKSNGNSPIDFQEPVTIKPIAKPNELSKSGKLVNGLGAAVSPSDSSFNAEDAYIVWSVKVDPKVALDFVKFDIIDSIGTEGLVFPTDEGDLQLKVEGDATFNVSPNTSDATINLANSKITFNLTNYVNRLDSKNPFTIQYRTKIQSGVFNYQIAPEKVTNSANLDWEIKSGGKTASTPSGDPATIGVGPLDSKSMTPIKKEGMSYEHKTRAFTWKITLGKEGVSFSKVKLVETPKLRTLDGNDKATHRFYNPLSTESTEAGKKAEAEAAIVNSIMDALSAKSITLKSESDPAVKVTITEGTSENVASTAEIVIDASKLTGENVPGGLSFNITTYNYGLKYLAGNHSGAVNDNEIIMKKAETVIGGTPLGTDYTAEANLSSNGQMYEKKAVAYDPESGDITWEITVNRKNTPAGDILLRDVIDSGLSYVAKSATYDHNQDVFSNSQEETVASQPGTNVTGGTYVQGNTIYFVFKGLKDGPHTLTYKTKIDYTTEKFKKEESVKFDNHIYAYAGNPYKANEWDGTIATDNNYTATVPNKILNKEKDITNAEKTQKAKYKITLNPSKMKLHPTTGKIRIKDELPDGLLLDEASVTLRDATVNVSGNGNFTVDVVPGAPVNPQPKVTYDTKTNTIELDVDDQKTYVLEYEVYILKRGSLENKVSLTGTVIDKGSANNERGESFSFGALSLGILRMPLALNNVFTQVVLKKVSNDGVTLLKGAEFGLYSEKDLGKEVATGITDDYGICSLVARNSDIGSPLPEVIYVREKVAPNVGGKQYQLSDLWIPIKIADIDKNEGNPDVTVENYPDTVPLDGKIKINKIEKGTAKKLEGAEFGVYSDAGCTLLVSSGVSDASGELTINSGLESDKTYYVKELVAPSGYELNAIATEVVAKSTVGESNTITIENELTPILPPDSPSPSPQPSTPPSLEPSTPPATPPSPNVDPDIPEYKGPEVPKGTLSVEIRWEGDDPSTRPDKVELELYKKEDDGTLTKINKKPKVTTNKDGNKVYTWTGLDEDATYVIRQKTPAGYTDTYSLEESPTGVGWVIVNKKTKANTAVERTVQKVVSKMVSPKTGQLTNFGVYVLCAMTAFAVLLVTLVIMLGVRLAYRNK